MSDISNRILQLITDKKMSYSDLSKHTGIPKSALQRYATGETPKIPLDRLELIAGALGVSAAYLMGWENRDETKRSAIDAHIAAHPELFRPAMRKVPLIGGVACGEPIYSPNLDTEFVLVNEDLDVDFAMVCKGDSMTGAGISDGDVVYIRKQEMVDNGQIAAVIIGEEVTLKRVYYYRDKNKLVLQPENPQYEPLIYTDDELAEIRILGRAVAQLRKIH